MIQSLSIHHVALIEDLTVQFGPGLHVLSGETGAGKSIVVDAVNLVLGGRGDRDLIRTGTDRAYVEAVFDVKDDVDVRDFLDAQQIECDGTVTLYRELTLSGRNVCRICGVLCSVSDLRACASLLMDVHGQHEGRFLMDSKYHLGFFDESGDEKHQKLLADVRLKSEVFLACHRKYSRLVRENERKQYRMEALKGALGEMRKAKLRPGEEEALCKEQERLADMEKIAGAVRTAWTVLSAGDEGAVLDLLKQANSALGTLDGTGEPYDSLARRAVSAYYELEEVSYELSRLMESSDFDPGKLKQITSRLDLIRHLCHRYGPSVEDVLKKQEELEEEWDKLSHLDEHLEEVTQEHRKLLQEYRAAARNLTASRKQLAEDFEKKMVAQLRDLGMEKTVFAVSFAPQGSKPPMPRSTGDDEIEFMFSANPGEPLKSLSRIASGGELSRMMLAIKSLEAERGGVGCMVFDEIDTGISGRMAQVVAEKMSMIARSRQVICVTHLPQIAAMANREYLVQKQEESGRTRTEVRLLDRDERILELARMLGGADGGGESAQTHAQHMLEQAETFQKQSAL
ncbi:MAG: DNA repair protein RecN [Clostridia bacterium]|nr:DNA repair protein RecN [Clostridia bacterium]